jgi:5'-nucleotidase
MSSTKPFASTRILITNDDGIDAPGLQLLEEIALELTDDVWVVAPDHEKSGASHSISLHVPIRMRRRDERHYAVVGTPTDCVLMAYYEIMRECRPTLVLSGINNGANLAEDVSYSGTASAAMEGTLLGIRSIALSVVRALDGEARWDAAAQHVPELLRRLIATPEWPAGSFVNINFPDALPEELTGARITTQGRRPPGAFVIDARIDARRVPYYWVKLTYPEGERHADTDLQAIHDKAISITPIQMDFTNHAWRSSLQGMLKH